MQRYVNIFPSTTKLTYVPYDDLTFNISIPDGMEMVKQSAYLLTDYKYTLDGGAVIPYDQDRNFDNFAGASCFIDNLSVNVGSLFVEGNFSYYSQYNKISTEVSVPPDELACQTKHSLELKCADPSQTRQFFRINDVGSNADITGSLCHLLRCGINRTNRNFNAQDIGGSIQLKMSIKDLLKAVYGANVLSTDILQFSNIRIQCLMQPISETGLLTMKITNSKRYDVQTGNAYLEYVLPIPTLSMSSYFATPAGLTANPYSSVQPVISEIIYTFNNSNNEVLTYNLTDTNEMVMNFRRSIIVGNSDDDDLSSFSVARLNSTTNSTFGIGLNFESVMNAGVKIGLNIYSDSDNNANQRVLFTFFNGQITLVNGEKVERVSPPLQLTASLPLNFTGNDMFQTNELLPIYKSDQRSEWIIDNQTILPDLRLVNLSATTQAGRLLYQTGIGGLIKNCMLYADGKILLSSIQSNNAHRLYGMNQLLRTNRGNKNVACELDGSFWGFKSVNQYGQQTLQITADTLNRTQVEGDFQGRVELKNFLSILSQVQYLHFKQLKLVIEWNSGANQSDVFTTATVGQNVVINQPTLVYERVIPDRALSECIFWDIAVDKLVQPLLAGAGAPSSTSEYFIQAFNNKTVDSIVVINDTGVNAVIGNNVAHAKFQETFQFFDEATPLLPNEADALELEKMMIDKYGSMNLPMLLNVPYVAGNGAEGDQIYDATIRNYMHTGSWKCLPINGRKLTSLKLKYTRSKINNVDPDAQFNQYFIGKVLKAVKFDKDGNAITQFL